MIHLTGQTLTYLTTVAWGAVALDLLLDVLSGKAFMALALAAVGLGVATSRRRNSDRIVASNSELKQTIAQLLSFDRIWALAVKATALARLEATNANGSPRDTGPFEIYSGKNLS